MLTNHWKQKLNNFRTTASWDRGQELSSSQTTSKLYKNDYASYTCQQKPREDIKSESCEGLKASDHLTTEPQIKRTLLPSGWPHKILGVLPKSLPDFLSAAGLKADRNFSKKYKTYIC